MMVKCPDDLIQFWQQFDPEKPPYAHPTDIPHLHGYSVCESIKSYADFVFSSRFGNFDDNRLDLSLLPIPYAGDLRKADIFLLLLNPGFNYTDYYAEYEVPEFRKRRLQNLNQDFGGVEFPFIGLDPVFLWHSGRYWEPRLRSVIRAIADHQRRTYLDVLREMSRRLAYIQLVPYHSPGFASHRLIDQLPSTEKARNLASEYLFPATIDGDKLVIITRRRKDWNPPRTKNPNLIIYQGAQNRGASLGVNTPGGEAILNRFRVPSEENR
jgi:hypothetical protein